MHQSCCLAANREQFWTTHDINAVVTRHVETVVLLSKGGKDEI